MFSKGQWIFAAFFVVTFVVGTIYSYRKDKNLHQKFYKGSSWILVGFLTFIGLLFLIKIYFKH